MKLRDLSPAQQRIVRLRAMGMSLSQVAKTVGSSIHTIRTHSHLTSVIVLGEERSGNAENRFIKVILELYDLVEKK